MAGERPGMEAISESRGAVFVVVVWKLHTMKNLLQLARTFLLGVILRERSDVPVMSVLFWNTGLRGVGSITKTNRKIETILFISPRKKIQQ